jgi:hypothetical protein
MWYSNENNVQHDESIAHNDKGSPRIKMKVFPTPQWLETWVYEGIVNSKIKIRILDTWGIAQKNWKKIPTNYLGKVGNV